MSEPDMSPGQVWDAFLGDRNGSFFASALSLLVLIPPDAFGEGVSRIDRETTIGPLLRPSAYTDGRRFRNANDYADVLRAAGELRRVLESLRSTTT